MTAARAATPQTVDALFNEAVALHRQNKIDEAEPLYRRYLALAPDHAQAWTNWGALLRKTGRLAAAIAAHRRALELQPGLETAMTNLGNALSDHGEHAQALAIRLTLLEKAPKDAGRIRDLCVALRGLGRHGEVIAAVDAAEAAGLAGGEVLLQRGLSRLTLGDYAGGFADFEHRYAGDEVALPTNAPWPRWQGEPLAGKRIAVLPEQGYGDAILMSRFLPGLRDLGAEVTMVVKPPLTRLFAGLDGVDAQVAAVRASDAFDFYTPNMSLPHFVGFGRGIPPSPRLTIPADSRARAAGLVAPFRRRFKIGVVWTGSLTYKANHRRSAGVEAFTGLASLPGVQLFSLYKGDALAAFHQSGMAGLIVDACGADRDFADTAALIDQMDLMITTDTAVVHVAASLGKPVWNLLSAEGFWLYGLGDTTPWYPTMRLMRQSRGGDWGELFGRVESALVAHLAVRQ